MDKIKIGIVGVGNCTSSLLQGIEYYKNKNSDDIIVRGNRQDESCSGNWICYD